MTGASETASCTGKDKDTLTMGGAVCAMKTMNTMRKRLFMNTSLTHFSFVLFLLEFCNCFVFEENTGWKARLVDGR
jgi:hypothetical protein